MTATTSPAMDGAMERLPRRLDAVECRVLGALLEKEQATPEYYPLTVNALIAACNQKTNRDPVMELDDDEVAAALERLRKNVLVWNSAGARTERWRHSVDRRWRLDPAAKALITLLLLRGAQTPGELRSRSERLHRFATTGEVEAALRELAGGREPLVRELPRAPGQKENRWTHLVGEEDPAGAAPAGPPRAAAAADRRPDPRPAASAAPASVIARLDELERRVADLERRLAAGNGG